MNWADVCAEVQSDLASLGSPGSASFAQGEGGVRVDVSFTSGVTCSVLIETPSAMGQEERRRMLVKTIARWLTANRRKTA